MNTETEWKVWLRRDLKSDSTHGRLEEDTNDSESEKLFWWLTFRRTATTWNAAQTACINDRGKLFSAVNGTEEPLERISRKVAGKFWLGIWTEISSYVFMISIIILWTTRNWLGMQENPMHVCLGSRSNVMWPLPLKKTVTATIMGDENWVWNSEISLISFSIFVTKWRPRKLSAQYPNIWCFFVHIWYSVRAMFPFNFRPFLDSETFKKNAQYWSDVMLFC